MPPTSQLCIINIVKLQNSTMLNWLAIIQKTMVFCFPLRSIINRFINYQWTTCHILNSFGCIKCWQPDRKLQYFNNLTLMCFYSLCWSGSKWVWSLYWETVDWSALIGLHYCIVYYCIVCIIHALSVELCRWRWLVLQCCFM